MAVTETTRKSFIAPPKRVERPAPAEDGTPAPEAPEAKKQAQAGAAAVVEAA